MSDSDARMARKRLPPSLFFIHIMKTAGTAFRQSIRAQFDDRELYPSRHYDPDFFHAHTSIGYLVGTSPDRRAHIRAFMGHFPYVATELLRQDLVTLTVLREPVDRTVSHLKHLHFYTPQNRDRSLEEIYEDPILQPCFLRNHQAKMFAFTEADAPTTYMDVLDIDERRLVEAKANLDKVDLIGFVDSYKRFLVDVEERFGWRLDKSMRRRVAPAGDVSKNLRRRIEADNAADLEFYDYAWCNHKPRA
jgi:hypothetical protein